MCQVSGYPAFQVHWRLPWRCCGKFGEGLPRHVVPSRVGRRRVVVTMAGEEVCLLSFDIEPCIGKLCFKQV